MLKQPNVLLVEVPPQFIALCETTGVSAVGWASCPPLLR
jgi:hypothetical protein